MAELIAQQGDIDRASALWQESLEISERIGDVISENITLSSRAVTMAQKGQTDYADELWDDPLKVLGLTVSNEAHTLNNMALWVEQKGDIKLALQLFQKSLDIKEQSGDLKGKATSLNNMAQTIAEQ
jgi:tetratricopeptide (TPR) repeat protein